MDSFTIFHEIATNPIDYAKKWKETHGGKVIGSLCSYAPEEIILASGSLGFRIFGTDTEISKADAHLPAYSCSLVRRTLENALSGTLDFLDGIVFPHTCDTIQRLSDIWRMNITNSFHLDLVLPVKLNTPSAIDYMIEIYSEFKSNLAGQLGIDITDDDLKRAVETCNRIRKAVGRLYALRQEIPGCISGSDMNALTKAGMVMDRYEFLNIVTGIVETIEKEKPELEPGKRLVISGGLCNMPDVYQAIENTGALIISDDLCTGRRFYEGVIEPQESILRGISQKYADRRLCPAKHHGLKTRGESLIQLVKESNADAVLHVYLKFCDPHGFDYPDIKNMLEEQNIPCMLIELEDLSAGGGQSETRLEAFVEML